MKHLRYGKIRIKEYWKVLECVIAVIILGIVAFVLKLYWEGCIYLTAAAFTVWNVLSPYDESFSIQDNIIFRRRFFFRVTDIIIPSKTIIVISQADIRNRTDIYSTTLKDRYAISILRDMPVSLVLEVLHGQNKIPSNVPMYTSSAVESGFDGYRFIYSFLYSEELLAQVLQSTECLIVIPESVKEQIRIQDSSVQIYIDLGH